MEDPSLPTARINPLQIRTAGKAPEEVRGSAELNLQGRLVVAHFTGQHHSKQTPQTQAAQVKVPAGSGG